LVPPLDDAQNKELDKIILKAEDELVNT
jgi:hypothetical protein